MDCPSGEYSPQLKMSALKSRWEFPLATSTKFMLVAVVVSSPLLSGDQLTLEQSPGWLSFS